MLSPVYQGSVKDLLGPVQVKGNTAFVFQYTDAYSIFDWGRMPDEIEHKGESLAIMAAHLFERLQDPKCWVDFSSSSSAQNLRKWIGKIPNYVKPKASAKRETPTSLSATFNELAEQFQTQGLRTHLLGVVPESEVKWKNSKEGIEVKSLSHFKEKSKDDHRFRNLAVQKVNVVYPKQESVMGRTVLDYGEVRSAHYPRIIPLEVIFRYQLPKGSSLLKKLKTDPSFLSTLPVPLDFLQNEIVEGAQFEFPIIELSTKLESEDRRIGFTEAVNASGITAAQLQDVLMQTMWVSGFLKNEFEKIGLELADGKLEWGIAETGEIFLIDAVGPDELRVLKNGAQLSKEILRYSYRNSTWAEGVERAKKQAKEKGASDWKRFAVEQPQSLPKESAELVSHLYQAMTNAVTGFEWFPQAWSLEKVCEEVQNLTEKLK